MRLLAKICVTGLLSASSFASVFGQTQEQPPVINPAKPQIGAGVQVGPGGVNIQVPGVNVQVPGRVTPAAPGAIVNTTPYYAYPQTPWFANADVREQLQLSDQQFNQLNQGYQQAWAPYNEGITRLDKNLTPAQRRDREAELRANFDKAFNPVVASVFADPAARQRYNQLYVQYQDYGAFQDPAVQQQLNLTPEQIQQFNQYGTTWNQQIHTWRGQYAANREQVRQQFREARREARQRIYTTLTPAQTTIYNNMIGKPYDFHSDVYFTQPAQTTTTLKPVVPE